MGIKESSNTVGVNVNQSNPYREFCFFILKSVFAFAARISLKFHAHKISSLNGISHFPPEGERTKGEIPQNCSTTLPLHGAIVCWPGTQTHVLVDYKVCI